MPKRRRKRRGQKKNIQNEQKKLTEKSKNVQLLGDKIPNLHIKDLLSVPLAKLPRPKNCCLFCLNISV